MALEMKAVVPIVALCDGDIEGVKCNHLAKDVQISLI